MTRSHRLDARSPRRSARGHLALALTLAVALTACRGGDRPEPGAAPAAPAAPAPTPAPTPDPTPAPPAPASEVEPVAAPDDAAVRADLERLVSGPARDAWYGVYMLGRKVGHGRFGYRRADAGEAGGWVVNIALSMAVEAGPDQRMTMDLVDRRHYADGDGFRLVEAFMETRASGVVDVRRAVRRPAEGDGDVFLLTRTLSGVAQPERTVPASDENLASLHATNPTDLSAIEIGAPVSFAAWDWEREADDTVVARFDAVETVRRAGIDTRVAVMTLRYPRLGLEMESRVTEEGALLEMNLGATLRLLQEEEEVAKSDVVGLDLLASGVEVDVALGDATAIERLVLDVTVPKGFTLPDASNQRVTPGEDGRMRVVITRAAGDAVTPEARARGLAEDATIDWRHDSVVALAARLTADLEGDRAKVDALARWVYERLDKRLATHIPTASEVLARRVGDCTEHTWLFTALARAAGVPARAVYGLAYAGDGERAFAYHAWAEVAIDGAWWPIDPTWDEAVADATHLKLGDELTGVGVAIGGLSIAVIERSPAP